MTDATMAQTSHDDDTHLCLRCHAHIAGLCAYVLHRKNGCPGKPVNGLSKDSESGTQHLIPREPIHSALTISPIADEKELLDEFFQSLELQSTRDRHCPERNGEILEFINNASVTDDKDRLPISSILNILDFSSDEEALFGSDDDAPPRHHTGGKWKPGHMENYRAKKCVKPQEAPHPNSSDGIDSDVSPRQRSCHPKWRGKLGAMKIQDSGKNPEISEVADENLSDISTVLNIDGKSNAFHCKVCERSFSNKYTAARHFISDYHQQLSLNHPDRINMFQQYHSYLLYFSLFQCRICRFYCNTLDDLKSHLTSPGHLSVAEALWGTIMCVGCKFSTNDNAALVAHIGSSTHLLKHKKSKACIIKERRYRITCRFCGLMQHSLVHMKRHVLCKHQHRNVDEDSAVANVVKHSQEDKCRLLKCSECDFETMLKRDMMVHNRDVHAGGSFSCVPCGASFATSSSLATHQTSVNHLHMERAGEVDSTKDTVDSTDFYQCKLCSKNFVNMKQLHLHVRRTHEREIEELAEYSCDICSKRFYDEKRLAFHKFFHSHILQDSDMFRFSQDLGVTRKKYSKFLQGVKNMKSKDTVVCPEAACGKALTKMSIWPHLRTHTGEKIFGCPLCEKRFSHAKSVQTHLKKHLGIYKVRCPLCNREFDENYIKTHLQSHGDRAMCDICSKTFASHSALQTHQRKSHKVKKFFCDFDKCGWQFMSRAALESHRRRHTGEKPFSCEFCDYRGKDASRIRKHVSSKHQQQTRKSFACDHCDYRGKSRNHIRRHQRIHTGSRPYHCPYCDYSCQTHHNLRKHILNTKKHQGAAVYRCKLCNFGSNTVNEFRWHLSSNHKDAAEACDSLVISSFTGVYLKEEDIQQPAEGTRIIPVRETNRANKDSEVLKCPMCRYTCKNRETLYRHMYTDNKKHPPKVDFTCELCDYRGVDANDIRYHKEDIHLNLLSTVSVLNGYLDNVESVDLGEQETVNGNSLTQDASSLCYISDMLKH